MMNESPFRTIVLALALVLSASIVAGGIVRFRQADRYVSVKGVAERDVSADIGIWPIRFTSNGDDLDRARQKIEGDRRRVLAFLSRHGIDSTMTELQALDVNDTHANPYQSGTASSRFIVSMTVLVRTTEPERVRAASQAVTELVAGGVVLSGGPYSGGPTYLFTRLNDFKPDMLAEATRNARDAAAEFARESKSKVGGIRHASQGVFQILPRDPAPGIQESNQIEKQLRVVATMDFFLK